MTVYGLLLNLYCANGTDAENDALPLPKNSVHKSAVALYRLCGTKALDSTSKSAAVYSPRRLFVGQIALREAKSQGESLLSKIFGGIYVLEIAE